jgi:hypothetical protein
MLISTPIIHQLELIYSHTANACSTVIIYAISTLIDAPTKYNTIKTNVLDHLSIILSPCSTKFDGCCSVCLPSVPSAPPSAISPARSRPPSTVRALLRVFFRKKRRNAVLPSPPHPAAATPSCPAARVSRPPPLARGAARLAAGEVGARLWYAGLMAGDEVEARPLQHRPPLPPHRSGSREEAPCRRVLPQRCVHGPHRRLPPPTTTRSWS